MVEPGNKWIEAHETLPGHTLTEHTADTFHELEQLRLTALTVEESHGDRFKRGECCYRYAVSQTAHNGLVVPDHEFVARCKCRIRGAHVYSQN